MLILASKSPTRKALLTGAGIAFEARSAGVNEREIEAAALGDGAGAAEVAKRLAEAKALAVTGEIAVGADQVLALDGTLLHKVETMDAARTRLGELRGRTHQLHAGVAIAKNGRIVWSAVETADLTMRNFSNAERDKVLALEGDAVLASVGAYRYEGPSVRLFEKIEGDYFAILGLPLLPLLAALRQVAPTVF